MNFNGFTSAMSKNYAPKGSLVWTSLLNDLKNNSFIFYLNLFVTIHFVL
jgi:hypothetical protein